MKKIKILGILTAIAVIAVFLLNTLDLQAAETNSADIMLTKINELRQEKGLNSLEIDEKLTEIATIRAEEASRVWSHTRPDGSDCLDLIPLSYDYAGENLSYCESMDNMYEIMFNALKESPTHLENMTLPEYNNIGISSYEVDGITYVAYIFGS